MSSTSASASTASTASQIGSGHGFQTSGLGSGSASNLPQDTRRYLMEGATIGMCSVMMVFFLLRAYCRFIMLKIMRIEDVLIIVGVVFAILQAVYIVLNARAGGGDHIWNIKIENAVFLVKTSYLNNLFFVISITFIKFSMVFQLMVITIKGSKTRKFVIITFGISIAFSVANFLLALLPCIPISYMWEQMNPAATTVATGKCMDLTVVSYTTSACSIVMDVLIWVAPMPLVWRLKVPKAQKIALVAVFSLGGGACAAAIGRCVSIYRLSNDEQAMKDAGYYKVELILWTVAETNIAIICTSLPLIRPLLKTVFPTVFGGSSARSRSKSNPAIVGYEHGSRTGQSASIGMGPMRKKPIVRDGYGSSTEELAEEMRRDGLGHGNGNIAICTAERVSSASEERIPGSGEAWGARRTDAKMV